MRKNLLSLAVSEAYFTTLDPIVFHYELKRAKRLDTHRKYELYGGTILGFLEQLPAAPAYPKYVRFSQAGSPLAPAFEPLHRLYA
jgi:hypothetical protein